VLTGRGHPFRRGVIIGAMTFLGGIFHTLPFLLADFHVAIGIASVVVALELLVISYIRYHYFNMRFWKSIAMVMLGGAIVFAAGIVIGTA
jgi:hypothetical protein